jgi:hypothetical protein
MKGHLSVLASILTALLVPVARGEVIPSADAEITYVVSGGYWEHAGRSGTFRIVVSDGGVEHVYSRVSAQWITEAPTSERDKRIAVSKILLSGHLISVGLPELTALNNQVRVTLSGVLTHMPEHLVSCVYLLKADETVVVERECS